MTPSIGHGKETFGRPVAQAWSPGKCRDSKLISL